MIILKANLHLEIVIYLQTEIIMNNLVSSVEKESFNYI